MDRERAKNWLERLDKIMPVVEHFANGGEVEKRFPPTGKWEPCSHPAFVESWQYRIEQTSDSVNWDHVHESINAIARDANGRVDAYSDNPEKGGQAWEPGVRCAWISNIEQTLASYKRGTVNWQNSLITRPENNSGEKE